MPPTRDEDVAEVQVAVVDPVPVGVAAGPVEHVVDGLDERVEDVPDEGLGDDLPFLDVLVKHVQERAFGAALHEDMAAGRGDVRSRYLDNVFAVGELLQDIGFARGVVGEVAREESLSDQEFAFVIVSLPYLYTAVESTFWS